MSSLKRKPKVDFDFKRVAREATERSIAARQAEYRQERAAVEEKNAEQSHLPQQMDPAYELPSKGKH